MAQLLFQVIRGRLQIAMSQSAPDVGEGCALLMYGDSPGVARGVKFRGMEVFFTDAF